VFDEIQTSSLFGEKKLFILNGILDDEHSKEKFLEQAEFLANAPHDILITAEKLLVGDTRKLEPFANIHTIAEKMVAKSGFDPFSLANAFASGDKKKSWIMLQQVAAQSDEMEPTHGMIWWKLKDMMVKKNSAFSQNQLNDMARKLIAAYHESRLGGIGMRERLEEFFLTVPVSKK
jgi:DNA polymerase III delta subunit